LDMTDTDTPEADDNRQPGESSEARAGLIAEARKYRKRAQEAERMFEESNARHAGQLAESTSRAERLEGMLSAVVVSDRLKSALADRGVKRVDQAARLLSDKFEVQIGEDGYSVCARDAEGQPTVEQVVDVWLADNRHYLPPSGDSGSGAYPGVTSPGRVSIEQLDLDPDRKVAFVARHGPAALVQLARSGKKNRRRQHRAKRR